MCIRFMLKYALLLIVCVCSITMTFGQTSNRHAKYDSLLVGDRITPAVSSVMMPRTYTEAIVYSSVITANSIFSSTGNKFYFVPPARSSYLFNTLQITHGVSAASRLNVGLDLSYRIGRMDADPESSPLKVMGNSSENLIQYERAFTSVGLRTRYVPFANTSNFVVQHTFFIPINPTSSESVFLGNNRYAFNTQLLYNQLLGRKFFLFGQADIFVRFKNETSKADLTIPVNVFATYLLSQHFYPFVMIGQSRNKAENNTIQSYIAGAGLQYQITSMYTLNFFYYDSFAGKNAGVWQSFNLGIRGVF